MVDDRAVAVALGARRAGLDLAEDGTLDRGHEARAVATRALLLLGTVRGTRAVAVLAGSEAVIADGLRAAARSLLQGDRERDGHIAAVRATGASAAARRTAAEEGREDVVHAHAAEDIREIDVAAAHAGTVSRPEAVVVGALLLVGQHRVRLVYLFELLFGVRVVGNIRMDLARLLQKRALDRALVCIAIDAQHLVVIPFVRHDELPSQQITATGCL